MILKGDAQHLKVAVVGSRSVKDTHYPELIEVLPIGAGTIISGGAKGADMLGKRYAQEYHLCYEEYPPDYKSFGRGAPMERNRRIVDMADYVVVMWDGRSHGAAYVIRYCLDTSTPVRVLICH
jgi:predicted Rossmann fold nucleotide-binding protein DprA/Smf involved in DNA uptake